MNLWRKSLSFDPKTDIPSLDGRVILVTGGNVGLGKQCVLEFARHRPSLIWLAARSRDKAEAALADIQTQLNDAPVPIKILDLDLASMASVKQAAATVLAGSDRLDILMLNAGRMAAPPELTADGYELQFGTNYLGHALLAELLVPLLEKTPGGDVRVVTLTSTGHEMCPKPQGIKFESLKTKADELGPFGRYGQSKLANILWSSQLARRHPRLTVASVHPGVVRTNLIRGATGSSIARYLGNVIERFLPSTEQGAKNQLWAAVGEGVKSGEYYVPVGIGGTGSALAKDDGLAERLWKWTEKELRQYAD